MMRNYYAGEVMASSKEPKPQSPKGRVCSFPECGAILSTYNPGERCALHPEHAVLGSGQKFTKPPARRPKKPAKKR